MELETCLNSVDTNLTYIKPESANGKIYVISGCEIQQEMLQHLRNLDKANLTVHDEI
jgi:hypothetical protein